MSSHNLGRHRAIRHLRPASSLSAAVWRSAKPTTKASAVIVISGAMVASLALPASAATVALSSTPTVVTDLQAVTPLAVPSIAQAPLVPPSFGSIGFTGVYKAPPAPKPVPTPAPVPAPAPVIAPARTVKAPVVERRIARASRSATRTPLSRAPARTPQAAPRASAPAAPAPAAPAPRSGGVLGIAATLNGIPYVYGGTTPAGFDCSGFTQYIFNKVGISLPRTAEQQRQFATTVSNPQPGDLVFFGAPAHHMGIYAGNGMLWDSPRTGKSVSKRPLWTTSGVTYGRVG